MYFWHKVQNEIMNSMNLDVIAHVIVRRDVLYLKIGRDFVGLCRHPALRHSHRSSLTDAYQVVIYGRSVWLLTRGLLLQTCRLRSD